MHAGALVLCEQVLFGPCIVPKHLEHAAAPKSTLYPVPLHSRRDETSEEKELQTEIQQLRTELEAFKVIFCGKSALNIGSALALVTWSSGVTLIGL